MRERLRSLIGPEAYGVHVDTIHGFCQWIIGRHPAIFEEWSMQTPITDLEKAKEMNTIVDRFLGHSELLNAKDPYAKNADILSRISQVKREGKSVQDLRAVADTYDVVMAGKSKEGTKVHERNCRQARKFREFIELFAAYEEMLRGSGRYDYDDMILTVLRALDSEEWLLLSLQEQFMSILVDEAQDINGAQWAVIERLTTCPAVPHDPNICIVGDDDQSIYRFQGANLQHMLGFRERFPNAPIVTLATSYRSTQAILSAAEKLIENNTGRLVGHIPGLTKHLVAAVSEEGEEPCLLRSPSDDAEPWMIADRIEERMKAGVPAGDIAVLTQTNRELFPLFDVLRARGIPVILSGKADLLAHPIVFQVIVILRALDRLHHDGALAAALACDGFRLHPADLARVAGAARNGKTSIRDVLLSLETTELHLHNTDAVIAARDAILSLHSKRMSRTVLQTVEAVLRETGLLPQAAAGGNPLDLAAVETFFQFVKAHCLERPSLRFDRFIDDLGFYADPEIPSVRLTYALPHLVSDGVRLMTAHQSKGLEFDTVILANFREGHWDKRRNHSGVALPEDVLFGWEAEEKAAERHEDERRVAYVAMTRAKRHLILSCPRELSVGQKTRAIAPSAFFAEAGTLPEMDVALHDPESASVLLHPPAAPLDDALTAELRVRLQTFTLSATSLRRFLRDPAEFLRIDMLGQPEHLEDSSVRALGYGSAMHWALREWALGVQRGSLLDASALITSFERYLREHTILTDRQRDDLLSIARDALPAYHAARLIGEPPVIYAVERDFRARLIGAVPEGIPDIALKGKIDRIDLAAPDARRATVIDFKTGAPQAPSAIRGGLEPGTVSRGEEGERFRQLVFYAVLLEHADPLIEAQEFVLDYIGERGEDPLRRSFVVTSQEKEDLRKLIAQVWTKIHTLDFTPVD